MCGLEKQKTFKIFTIFSILISLLNKSKVDGEYLDGNHPSFTEINKNSTDSVNNHEKILSRKRRYLIFPEGSSLQVVFDEIIPIVDYNNFLILGVTVALAWELPSKPPSELFEDLQEKLNDGTLGLRKDENVEILKYADKPKKILPLKSKVIPDVSTKPNYYYSPYKHLVYNQNRRTNFNPSEKAFYGPPNDHNLRPMAQNNRNYYPRKDLKTRFNYYGNSSWNMKENDNSRQDNHRSDHRNNPHMWGQPPWAKLNNRKTTIFHDHPYVRNRNEYEANWKRKHRIYPVMGKRSVISETLTMEQKINLKYHRNTRHVLYTKIGKYLDSQGKSGLHCVLKILCQTGKRKNEIEPGSFIGEIMRAIFTFPQNDENIVDQKHKIYDEAHSHEGNCNERFPECSHTLWGNEFP